MHGAPKSMQSPILVRWIGGRLHRKAPVSVERRRRDAVAAGPSDAKFGENELSREIVIKIETRREQSFDFFAV